MNFGGSTNESDSFAIMQKAADQAINCFDTANVYNQGESERIIGKFLKENNLRDQIILATKLYNRVGELPNDKGATRYHIIKACEDSLHRLQTDHIDLYQLHRPALTVSQDETLRALDDLIRGGKVLYIGTSTYPAWMVMEALSISESYRLNGHVSEQRPYNLLDRRIENELILLAQKYDLAILPWSPTAMGILAGRYSRTNYFPEGLRAQLWGTNDAIKVRVTQRALEVAQVVSQMAQERGFTASQLALLWTKDQPGITAPIIGPRTLTHLEDAIGMLDKTLDNADRPLFDALVHPGNAVSDFHNSNDWMKARFF